MKRFVSALGIVALAAVWTVGPAMAQDTVKDKAEKAQDKAKTKAERAADKADDKMERAKDKAREVKDKVSDKARETKEKIKDKAAAKTERGEPATDVRAMQTALKDKGHDPGPIDGRMGPRTAGALRNFQKSENLTVTGRLDAATAEKLGVTAPAASARTDTPNAKTQAGGGN